MRAVLATTFGAPSQLIVAELDRPTPIGRQVLVEVLAAGVNYPDLLVVRGEYQIRPPLPFVPGKELVGIVRGVGPEVKSLRPDDRVAAQVEYGAFAELVAVDELLCTKVPEGVDDETAAVFGLVFLTAHIGLLTRAGLKAGQCVLITGATGAVGLAAIQVAKDAGARVIAAVRQSGGGQVALDHGADHFVLSDPSMRDEVRRLTDDHGADIVFECVGGEVFKTALRCVRWSGHLVVAGFAAGTVPSVSAGYLLVKNIGLLGIQVTDYRDRHPEQTSGVLGDLLEKCAAGTFRTSVVGTYRFNDVSAALGRIELGNPGGRLALVP